MYLRIESFRFEIWRHVQRSVAAIEAIFRSHAAGLIFELCMQRGVVAS